MQHAHLSHLLLVVLCFACAACSRKPTQHHESSDGSPTMAKDSTHGRVFGPTVAGRFYPDDPKRLRASVESYLEQGKKNASIPPDRRLVALVAPHAGYVYSGPVAGVAYAASKNATVRNVVVLSPSHHGRRPHACTLDADAYGTPLGEMTIALSIVRSLTARGPDLVKVDESIFVPEHALDVHVPFLQVAFPEAKLVPIIVPMMSRDRLEALGKLLHEVIGQDPTALVVASSDLSHFYDHEQARLIDNAIVGELERKDVGAVLAKHDERRGPCGVAPIVATLSYLERFGDGGLVKRMQVLNSGDVHPDGRDRVVGYAALSLTVPASP